MKNLAPIALFVYNRPIHTRKTLEALAQNDEAKESHIFVFCDGPRSDTDEKGKQAILEVREVIKSFSEFGKVTAHYSDLNRGLADSIKFGIDHVLKEYEKIIVIEDDIVVSRGFLRWMNEALDLYNNEERVMQISSYVPESNYAWLLPQNFLLRLMSCWGWATWRRAWECVNWSGYDLLCKLEGRSGRCREFDLDGTANFSQQLRDNIDGKLKTWAVFWGASIYLEGGLCFYPQKSLCQNIGTLNSGSNFVGLSDERYAVNAADSVPVCDILQSEESKIARFYFKGFYKYGRDSRLRKRFRIKLGLWKHTIWKVKKAGLRKIILAIKNKIKRLPPFSDLFNQIKHHQEARFQLRRELGEVLQQKWVLELDQFEALGNSQDHSQGDGVIHITFTVGRGGAGQIAATLHNGLSEIYLSRMLTREMMGYSASNSEPFKYRGIEQELQQFGRDSSMRGFCGSLTRDLAGKFRDVADSQLVHLHNLHPDYFNLFELPKLSSEKKVIWTLHDEASFTGHCAFTLGCEGWLKSCVCCPYIDRYVDLKADRAEEHFLLKQKIYSKSRLTLVCPSNWLAGRVAKSILRSNPVKVIPNGVDLKEFFPGDKTEARNRLGIPLDKFVCGYCADAGMTNPFKGGDIMKEIIGNASNSAFFFVSVGGPQAGRSAHHAELGYVSDRKILADMYRSLDLFVYPTKADSFGLVVAEAMACGTPVVGSPVDAIPEIIQDGVSGFITESNTSEAFLGILLKLRDMPLVDYQNNAIRRVREHFSLDLMLKRYAELYASLGVLPRKRDLKN